MTSDVSWLNPDRIFLFDTLKDKLLFSAVFNVGLGFIYEHQHMGHIAVLNKTKQTNYGSLYLWPGGFHL